MQWDNGGEFKKSLPIVTLMERNQMTQPLYLPNGGWDQRIHAFKYTELVTCYAVVTQRYLVILDTLISPKTMRVMMDHLKPQMTSERRLLVVNTHSDWDHVWGNQLFAGEDALYPAPIIASRRCRADFDLPEAQSQLADLQKQNPGELDDVRITPPTLLFDERLTIEGGDLTLEIFPARGHTHDHTAIYVPEIKTLFAADSAERPYPQPRKPEMLPQMRQTLAELATYDAEVVLYCHADDVDGAVIRDNIAYFHFIEEKCRRAKAAGIELPDEKEADVASLIDCSFVDAMGQDSGDYHNYYQTQGHYDQIRAVWQSM